MADNQTVPETRPESERPPSASPPAPAAPSRWTAGRIAMLVVGSLLGLIALAAMACGAYGLWLHTTQRSNGYVMTSSERFATGGYALSTRTLEVSSDVPSFLYGRDWLGDVRIRGGSVDPNRSLFIGIAPKDVVDRYLAGVAHSTVEDVNFGPFDATYSTSGGTVVPPRPASQTFWVKSGTSTASWQIRNGHWRVVVMNADASPGVLADATVGVTMRGELPVAFSLLGVGLALAAAAVAIGVGGRRNG